MSKKFTLIFDYDDFLQQNALRFSQTGERMMLYIRIRFVLLTKLNFMA